MSRISRFRRTYLNLTSIPFWAAHVLGIGLLFVAGFWASGLIWTAAVYFVGMFFVTGGYHRYFSHRTFKTSRPFQFLLAVGAQATSQKGVLWWAANHRHHHKYSDQPEDAHSVRHSGFWWAHMGWFLSNEFRATRTEAVRDLMRYPELRFINHPAVMFLPGILYALLCWAIAGVEGLTYGALFPLVLIWHGTYTINSLCHVFGKQRYDSGDDSKNSLPLALITLGEGWHNNHHHYQATVRQGFRWYEIDITYYVLWALAKIRLVWDLRQPPAHVVEGRPNDKQLELAAREQDPSADVARAA